MGPGFESLEVHQILNVKSKDLAFFLYVGKRLHTFCTPFAHLPESGAFLRKVCTACFPLHKKSLVGARPLHLAGARPFGHSKAPLGLLLLRKRESFMQTERSSILCVHQPDGFKDLLTGDFCCHRLFILPGLGCCRDQVLGVEVCKEKHKALYYNKTIRTG